MYLDDCLKITEVLCYLSTMYIFYRMYDDINKKIDGLHK